VSKKYWYSNAIELEIELEDAEQGSHQGSCDNDIEELIDVPYIRAQLDTVDPGKLIEDLGEYGAWDDDELEDHEQNLRRLLWLACGDITEEN